MPLTAEQKEARRKGIGGSDAGVIAGRSKWKSAYQLYLEKTGQADTDEIETLAQKRGNWLEEYVAQEYMEVTGRKVRRVGTRWHKDLPWMLTHMDRQILGDPRGPGALEIKCAHPFAAQEWKTVGLPDTYYLQLQHTLAVTGYTWGAFAVWIYGEPLIPFEIPRDEETIAALMELEGAFWRCVETRTPPPLDGSQQTAKTLQRQYPKDNGQAVALDNLASEVKRLLELKQTSKYLDEEIGRLENVIKSGMGEAAEATVTAIGRVTWKTYDKAAADEVDKAKLRLQFPDAYKACVTTKPATSYRRFCLYPERAIKAEIEGTDKAAALPELTAAALAPPEVPLRAINFDL